MAVEDNLGGRSAELTFPQTSRSDAGNYRCVAKSEAGSFQAEVAAVMERKFNLVIVMLLQIF